jgi:hypothetical protein
MRRIKSERQIQLWVTTALSALLCAYCGSADRGAVRLYKGERRPASEIARIIKTKGLLGYCSIAPSNHWSTLKDTIEIGPGQTEIRIEPGKFTKPTYYDPPRSLIVDRRTDSRAVNWPATKYGPILPCCEWTLAFDFQAGHVYELYVSQGNVLVISDRNSGIRKTVKPSNGDCQLCR